MKSEYADRQSRAVIVPPTPAEFAQAKSRGLSSLSSEQLRSLRLESRTAKRSTTKPAPLRTKGTPDSEKTEKQLRHKVVRLEKTVAALQLKILTGR